jgi:hypothetical protein
MSGSMTQGEGAKMEGGGRCRRISVCWGRKLQDGGARACTSVGWWRDMILRTPDDGHAFERGYLGFC